jgi:hypothetical protein
MVVVVDISSTTMVKVQVVVTGEGHGAVRRGRVKLGLVGYVNIRGWRAGMTSSSATQTGCEHTSIRLVGCDLKQYRAR